MEYAKKNAESEQLNSKSLTYYSTFKAPRLLTNDWFPKQFTAHTVKRNHRKARSLHLSKRKERSDGDNRGWTRIKPAKGIIR